MVRHKGARSNSAVAGTIRTKSRSRFRNSGSADGMTPCMHSRAFAHATRGIGKLRIERGRDGMRWCFTDASHADAFHAEFGGERIRDLIS